MTTLVFAGFALAAAAPVLHRLAGRWSGSLLALYPAAGFVWLLLAGARREHMAWVPTLGVELTFALDGLSLLFALLITGIGAVVLTYAGAYMAERERQGRFYAFLVAFMASMLGLVLADNVLALFVFWELTSITSFLLIGFEHDRPAARAAALQALYVTAGGGLALLAGLLLLGSAAGTYELSAIAAAGDTVRADARYALILLLVLAGALTKSAQAPFHFWLPNAMEAPTPVSAYLHSSTMVKAGVYLLARVHPAVGGTELWVTLVGGIGAITALTGAVMAWRQTDLKRILAYSTVSALGLITILLGIGSDLALRAAVLFLLAHALYKGSLFLVAGSVAHGTGERDLTRLRGLRRAMPATAVAAVLAGLSMAGVPPFGGFLAKEHLVEVVLHETGLNVAASAAVIAVSVLLAAVALTIGVRVFTGTPTAAAEHAHEGPLPLWSGAVLLAGLGAVAGLWPALFTDRLVADAAAAAGAQSVGTPLAWWHGVTPALATGLAALAAGGALAIGWRPPAERRLPRLAVAGPERLYAAWLQALMRFAVWQTRLLQSGFLRHYLLITIATAAVLSGATFLVFGAVPSVRLGGIPLHEAGLLLLLVASAIAASAARSRLGSIAALGIAGYAVALLYIVFGAPDLAMTQFVVETLTVVLFLFAFRGLPAAKFLEGGTGRLRNAIVAGAAGLVMATLVLAATTAAHEAPVSTFFLERSLPDGHGRNVVNVILVDFRALDTLGEISVLALAGVGVYALLKLRPAYQGVRR